MDQAVKLDSAIRTLLRTLSLDERKAPKFPDNGRMGLLDMELLALIGENPGIQAKDLIAELGVRPTTMQSAVDRLVRRKLIRRDLSKLKGRAVALSLTQSGDALAQEIKVHNLVNCEALLAALDLGDRELFLENLKKMADAAARSM